MVVDQFEELFTLNPTEVQSRFADLLGRLTLDANVRVLLSMRDDFLNYCNRHEALRPVFHELTPLDPPTGIALRRAVVQPALKCGYRFEDDALVEEMVAEVREERGALPLVAFTASRLWKHRDQKQGLLTREAYEKIGGVGGALAQHGEETLKKVGVERTPIVREIFRNLVTAQGTRAARDRNELISVFEEETRETAAQVLDILIDARLLTSYEVPAGDGEDSGRRRIEIIHESLLSAWPRLVRWQTQDTEGAQLRDELRQAAQMWEQHERTDDLLWTGTAFDEYQLWHERYPGGLTEIEEAFTRAMTAHAERSRRRRRALMLSLVASLLIVVGVISVFWQRAVAETHRAEAAGLSSLAHFELEDHPSAAIAYAIASLELADIPSVRRLVVEALWRGPTEIRFPAKAYSGVDFSPDAQWLVTVGADSWKIWPADGGPPMTFDGIQRPYYGEFSPNGDLIAIIVNEWRKVELWSFPEGRLLRTLDPGPTKTYNIQFSPDGKRLISSTVERRQKGQTGHVLLRSWPLEGGEPTLLARLETPPDPFISMGAVNPQESLLVWTHGRASPPIERMEQRPFHLERGISRGQEPGLWWAGFDPLGESLYTIDSERTARLWSLADNSPKLVRTLGEGMMGLRFDRSGSMIAAPTFGIPTALLWNLSGPPDAQPIRLERAVEAIGGDWGEEGQGLAFHPQGNWLATGYNGTVSLWPLTRPYPRILRDHEEDDLKVVHFYADRGQGGLGFTPDGKKLVSRSELSIRVWPLDGSSGERSRTLFKAREGERFGESAMAPDGSFVAISVADGVSLLPLDGGPPRELEGVGSSPGVIAVGPQARFVAAGVGGENASIHVWDLVTGERHTLDAGDAQSGNLWLTDAGHLLVAGRTSERERWLQRWDLKAAPPRLLAEVELEGNIGAFSEDGRQAIGWWDEDGGETVWVYDLDTNEVRRTRELASHGRVNGWATFDPAREIVVTGTRDGAVQVGNLQGSEPHLLLGHTGGINKLAISPDGQWIASGGPDGTIRLWPMPDLSQPPIHTLPRDELLAKLCPLTNLRAVRDAESDTGWKLTIGAFPGWQEAPTW